MSVNGILRKLPSVDSVLASPGVTPLIEEYGRGLVRDIVRDVLDKTRADILNGGQSADTPMWKSKIVKETEKALRLICSSRLKKLVNCSGVISHTNLGRAILAEEAAKAAYDAAVSNVNVEYYIGSGARGDRDDIVEELITRITGAEAATVVNNNAAAVLLALNTLSEGRQTIVSRGELIEIGGSFRLPEIMSKSGCVLKEVGTTNRTSLADYENAINENTALIMRAHTSNYRIIGFTAQPSLSEIAALAKSKSVPLMIDLGSGTLVDLRRFGLPHEPTVQETLADGADIVTISGDKLLGGPQAGVIAGKKELIEKIKKNHLKRALRCDKLTLAAMEATLRIYLDPEKAADRIPTLRFLKRGIEEIRQTASEAATALSGFFCDAAEVSIMDDVCRAGSGALPEVDIASVSVAIRHMDMGPNELAEWFRRLDPPVIGRVADDLFRLDMRCVENVEEIKASLPTRP